MPCTFTGSIEGDRALASREALTTVTDMLCRVLTAIDKHHSEVERDQFCAGIVLPIDVNNFWKEHKKLDAKREQDEAKRREKVKASALSKLSEEEREALGL